MRSKKGFTLIELLAVIVILAVIALIATPVIMNVINDSQKGAAKDAMYGYVKAVELASAKAITPTTDAPSGEKFVTVDGNIYEGSTKVLDVTLKGTKPKDKTGVVKLLNGTVTYAELEFNGILVTYNGKDASIGESSSTPTPKSTFDLGEEVYYNPVANKKCSSSEVNTSDNAKTGCLKWNVITKDDKASNININIMLDHNSTAKIAWISKEDYVAAGGIESEYGGDGNNSKGPITANNQLQTDAVTWSSSIKNSVRLITGEEIANIVSDETWSSSSYQSISLSSNAWLYQNLSDANTEAKPAGYWTSTKNVSNTRHAWYVSSSKNLSAYSVNLSAYYGVRPVITISKSVIA